MRLGTGFAIRLGTLVGTLALAAAAAAIASEAPNNTAYVDPKSGVDSGSCGAPATPCASLNQGLNNIAAGGSVFIVSGGTFGPVYLNGAVTIVGPADRSAVVMFLASTAPGCIGAAVGSCGLPTANYALEVAASASDTIKLKNLVIDNAAGTNGAVKIGNAFNVSLDRVVVLGGSGTIAQMMLVAPETNTQFQLFMSHCDIGFSTSGGAVLVRPLTGTGVEADVVASEFHNAKFGLKLDSTATLGFVRAAVTDSEFFSFNGSGLALVGTGTGFSFLHLGHSNVQNSGMFGVQVNGVDSQAVLDESRITRNHIGINAQGNPSIFTYGNSRIVTNALNCAVNGADTDCTLVLNHPLTEF